MQYLLALPTVVTVLALVFMGLIVIRNNRGLANKLFIAFIAVDSLWLLSVLIVNNAGWGLDVFWSRLAFAAAATLLVALHAFTNALLDINHRSLYKVIVYGGGIVVAVMTLTTDLIVQGVTINTSASGVSSPFPVYGVFSPLFTGYLVTSLLMFLFVMVRRIKLLRKSKANPREKNQLKAVVWGFVGFIIVSLLTNLILPTIVSNAWPSQLAPIGSLFLAFAFFYAMMRYKLFEIRSTVIRSTTYLMLLAMLAFAFVGAINIGGTFGVFTANETVQLLFNTSVALAIAVSFHPLRRLFDKITDKIFFRDAYDPQSFIDELNQILAANIELDELLAKAATIISHNLKAEYCVFGIKETKFRGQRIIGATIKDFSQDDINTAIHIVPGAMGNVIVTDRLLPPHDKPKDLLARNDIAVLVRIAQPPAVHPVGLGYLLLGQKKNGNPYDTQDVQILEIISKALLVAVQNALRFEEIGVFNKTLQSKIDEATVRLRHTNAKLQQMDEAKDEFVSMASHQLRTPLTSVKGYISMVLEGDVGKITPMQRQLLSEAFTSSERMVHLIGDFLNVSRLQTGKFMVERRKVDLAKLIDQEVDSLKTTAEAHNLKLKYRRPSYFPVLYLDEGKLRQVVMNFIDNAIYYSREYSTITIELAIAQSDVVLKVHDTGIGVPKSEQAHLFTKFFRASNARKQRPDGTGVGLFLAKKVIVAHGGTILFESTEGEGSMFGFRLPIKKLSAAPADNTNKLDK